MDDAWSEVIIAAFHDPAISAGLPVSIAARSAQYVSYDMQWCWSVITWRAAVPGETAVALTLTCGMALGAYDTLLLCLTLPAGCCLRVVVAQDSGIFDAGEVASGDDLRMEVAVPLRSGCLTRSRWNSCHALPARLQCC